MKDSELGKRRFGLAAVLFILAVLLVELYEVAVHRAVSQASPAVKPSVRQGSLELRADRFGDQWKIAWNPGTAPFQRASRAELVIDDGPRHTIQNLSSTQILSGSTLYSPQNDDVVFRLRVFDPDGNPISGSVRLLRFCPPAQPPNALETDKQAANPPLKRASIIKRSRRRKQRPPPPPVINQTASSRSGLDSDAILNIAPTPIALDATEAHDAVEDRTPNHQASSSGQDLAASSETPFVPPRKSGRFFHLFKKAGRKVARLFHRKS